MAIQDEQSHYWETDEMIGRMLRVFFTPEEIRQRECDFETHTIIPLLQRWHVPYRQQVWCEMRSSGGSPFGRIDFLINTEDNRAPLTLFENKRQITSETQRLRAVQQANAYAQARRLRSFVVAAPEGLWVYSRRYGKPYLQGSFTAAEVRAGAPEAKLLLMAIHQRTR